jgi:hypothetical protein
MASEPSSRERAIAAAYMGFHRSEPSVKIAAACSLPGPTFYEEIHQAVGAALDAAHEAGAIVWSDEHEVLREVVGELVTACYPGVYPTDDDVRAADRVERGRRQIAALKRLRELIGDDDGD